MEGESIEAELQRTNVVTLVLENRKWAARSDPGIDVLTCVSGVSLYLILNSLIIKIVRQKLNLKIFGDVQGVGFRYYTVELARDLGLSGWVKNDSDGSVELLAEGEEEKLQNLLSWAKKGPPLAKVTNIESTFSEATNQFSSFEVRR